MLFIYQSFKFTGCFAGRWNHLQAPYSVTAVTSKLGFLLNLQANSNTIRRFKSFCVEYTFSIAKNIKAIQTKLMEPAYYNNNYPPPAPNQYNPYNQPYSNQPPYRQPYNQAAPYVQPNPPIVYHVDLNQGGAHCPVCNRNASLMPIRETSTTQWIWCFVIFLLFWPCCWVPFVMDKCSDIRYECSNCRAVRNWYRAPCCP